MIRWSVIVVVALCGVLAAVYPATRASSAKDGDQRDNTRECERVRFIGVAKAMGLSCVSDAYDGATGRKLILSDFPVSFERSARLAINNPAFDRWQGTVAVYLGDAHMWRANNNPEHPERSAILGDSFAYGDPELIERLRTAAP
jgi:hypothetical protein